MNNILHFVEVKRPDGGTIIVNVNHIVWFNADYICVGFEECYTLAPGQFDYLCHMLGRVVAIMRLPNEAGAKPAQDGTR